MKSLHLFVTSLPQIVYRCSITTCVSVEPGGNLNVIKKDEHKTPSVGSLDTKVYLLQSLHCCRRKERERGDVSTDLDRQREQSVRGERDSYNLSYFSPLTKPPTPPELRLLSVVSLVLPLLFLWLTNRPFCVSLPASVSPPISGGRFPPFFNAHWLTTTTLSVT